MFYDVIFRTYPFFSNLRDGFFLLLSPKVHDRYESFHNLKWKTKKKCIGVKFSS